MRPRRPPLPLLPLLPLPLLAACGTISDEALLADLDFLDAMPAEERHLLRVADDTTPPDTDDLPGSLEFAHRIATDSNTFVLTLLDGVDRVRALPPTSRDGDARAWGPLTWIHEGASITLSATAARDGDRYDWSFTGHPSGDPADTVTILQGTHWAGSTVASGDGQFTWDHTSFARWHGRDDTGLVTVGYDLRGGTDLQIRAEGLSVPGLPPGDSTSRYRIFPADDAPDPPDTPGDPAPAWIGDYQLRTTADPGNGDAPADVALRVRFLPSRAGRADALILGASGTAYTWTQCWDSAARLTYDRLDPSERPVTGTPDACAWESFAAAEL